MYIPCLKARQAERAALAAAPAAASILPLIEFVPQDSGSGARGQASEILYTFEQLETVWPRPFLMDVRLLCDTAADRLSAWALVEFWAVRHPALGAVPCVNPEDDPLVLAGAGGAARACQRAAFRVEVQPGTSAAHVTAALGSALGSVGLGRSSVDLILDWRDEPFTSRLDALEQQARALLAAVGAGWRQVTVLGTSSGPNPAVDGVETRTRREWGLWLRLAHAGQSPQSVDFGDYAGFAAPAPPGFGRGVIPTLRYTADTTLHIARFHHDLATGQNGLQICCTELNRSGVLSGPTFSPGDLKIAGVLSGTDADRGNATTWRTIALQHHLSMVAHQMGGPLPPIHPWERSEIFRPLACDAYLRERCFHRDQ